MPDEKHYHSDCVPRMGLVLEDGNSVDLPLPSPLEAIQRKPRILGSEIENFSDEKPLGISENRLILQGVELQEVTVRNNTTDQLIQIPIRSPSVPWLSITTSPSPNASSMLLLNPNEEGVITLQPHWIRPVAQKFRLSLNPEKFIVIYSNGAQGIREVVVISLIVVWLFGLITVTSFFLTFPIFTPSNWFPDLLVYFVISTIFLAIFVYLMPSRPLWLARKLLTTSSQQPSSRANSLILAKIDDLLFSPNRFSHARENLTRLILFVFLESLCLAIPWTFLTVVLAFIIRWIPILGIIIYLALFGASIYFLYRFLEGYSLPKMIETFQKFFPAK